MQLDTLPRLCCVARVTELRRRWRMRRRCARWSRGNGADVRISDAGRRRRNDDGRIGGRRTIRRIVFARRVSFQHTTDASPYCFGQETASNFSLKRNFPSRWLRLTNAVDVLHLARTDRTSNLGLLYFVVARILPVVRRIEIAVRLQVLGTLLVQRNEALFAAVQLGTHADRRQTRR
jgi:hypothetical protein